jgi:hypothetical protein
VARKPAADDGSLKRLGGGRWQTRDERFTIEPQSGTWVVVDGEQTDDLGLALVRGPFRSLTDAKEAIAAARTAPPAASPLADRIGRRAAKAEGTPAEPARPQRDAGAPKPEPGSPAQPDRTSGSKARDEPPAEPRWIAALDPDERRKARRLIARLEAAGAPDPDGMARRDIVGDVAAVASFAIESQLAALGSDPDARKVAEMLADGRDEDLGVRWRLVDGDGRPIRIEPGRGQSARARGR